MIDLVINFDNGLDKTALYNILKGLNGEQVIKIKKRSKGRSMKYNRYYWGCVMDYAEREIYMPKILIHNYYKHKFMHLVKLTDDFELTTTDMNFETQKQFVDLVRDDLKEFFGIVTPDPDGVIL